MKFKWWGQACFCITLSSGLQIITDPYNRDLGYAAIDDRADVVTVSHGHFDHNSVDSLPGEPRVLNTVGNFNHEELEITGIQSYHDEEQGEQRGENRIYFFETPEGTICHLGDLGHAPADKHLEIIRDVDYLLIPVGGHFTIDGDQAFEVVETLRPTAIFPMHYSTEAIDLPIEGPERFTAHFREESIVKVEGSELKLSSPPASPTVYLLDYVQ